MKIVVGEVMEDIIVCETDNATLRLPRELFPRRIFPGMWQIMKTASLPCGMKKTRWMKSRWQCCLKCLCKSLCEKAGDGADGRHPFYLLYFIF